MSGRQDFTVRDAQAIHQDGLDVFTGDQSMGTHKLTAVTNPGAAQDAATLASVQAATAALLSTNTPQPLGTAAPGNGTLASKDNHVHAHGDLAGGTFHAVAGGGSAGFMTDADKTKLDGISAGATMSGSGTAGKVARFSGATTLGNAAIQDDGTTTTFLGGLRVKVDAGGAATLNLATNTFYAVTGSGARTITLPRLTSSATDGVVFLIKDVGGNAGAGNITVAADATVPDLIDAANTKVISNNYGCLTLIGRWVSVSSKGIWAIVTASWASRGGPAIWGKTDGRSYFTPQSHELRRQAGRNVARAGDFRQR